MGVYSSATPTDVQRRAGLRHMQSMLRALVCPTAGEEQFTNGGFETGDFTGWTTADDGGGGVWGVVTEGVEHPPESNKVVPSAGTYMARFDNTAGLGATTGTIQQDFSPTIPVECFLPTSVFTVKTNHKAHGCPAPAPTVWKIEVLYTDGTSTEVDISGDAPDTWVTHDLKAVLASGKTVKGIKFTATLEQWNSPEVFIDECTCVI